MLSIDRHLEPLQVRRDSDHTIGWLREIEVHRLRAVLQHEPGHEIGANRVGALRGHLEGDLVAEIRDARGAILSQ